MEDKFTTKTTVRVVPLTDVGCFATAADLTEEMRMILIKEGFVPLHGGMWIRKDSYHECHDTILSNLGTVDMYVSVDC